MCCRTGLIQDDIPKKSKLQNTASGAQNRRDAPQHPFDGRQKIVRMQKDKSKHCYNGMG